MLDEWAVLGVGAALLPRSDVNDTLSEGGMTAIYAAEQADNTTHALPNAPNATDD